MKKIALSTLAASVFVLPLSASANPDALNDLGVAVNYGLFSGPTLELSYPLSDELNLRGALSSGMALSETENGTGTEPDYAVKADGGIHRLALDYRPMGGSFFISGGYAINSFKLTADASTTDTQTVTIGDTDYTASGTVNLDGALDWDNAPTLSLGWGHSPSEGWGAMFEIGAIFTGAPNLNIKGSGLVDDGAGGTIDVSSDPTVQAAINKEEAKLKDDIADFDFLPILQAGITYRF